MKKWKKIMAGCAAITLIIQLPVFAPQKNYSEADPVYDIAKVYEVPMDVQMELYNSCYDCHSNYTKEYPWYYHIQPISWWMARHVNQAKAKLNFSEFASYSPEEAAKKFNDIQDVMEEKAMPIKPYLLMHDEARLTDDEYKGLAEWATHLHDKIMAKQDSMQKK
ncbi:MAG: heme-binding domain-containing protein [Bacteroidetes bacterium]|jgi:hypothetical protein|nr:heme-binding domain-containing protein [Bacteroidota bacterium]MBS1980146.1 heme-binding domain-containing protein [Bacteroidota bacterium]